MAFRLDAMRRRGRPPFRAVVCGHDAPHLARGLCSACYQALFYAQRREGRFLAIPEFLALRAERLARREEAFRRAAQARNEAARGTHISIPIVAADFGSRTCSRCQERFTARHSAQSVCTLWCAYPWTI